MYEGTILFWNSCYSQFFNSSFIDCKGNIFFNSEQFMLYHKALIFNDKQTAHKIIKSINPLRLKEYSYEIKNYDHNIWKQHRYDVLVLGNYYKFNQNCNIYQSLMSSQCDLSKRCDRFWLYQNYDLHKQPEFWKQIEILGSALMKVKELFKEKNTIYIKHLETKIYKDKT